MDTVQLRNNSQWASLTRYDTTVILKCFFGEACAGYDQERISFPEDSSI